MANEKDPKILAASSDAAASNDQNHAIREKAIMSETPDQMYDTESPEHEGEYEMDEQEQKRILRKIDWAIVPYSALLYLLSFLDRVNIGQARVAGLEKGLNVGFFFDFLAVWQFVQLGEPYAASEQIVTREGILMEIPSNLALKILRPQYWITINMVLWSICTIALGLVKTGPQLIAVRFLLGLFEGGLFPGLNFIFSLYYTREQLGQRVAIFFAGATLAGAFGGLLAYGLRQIHGTGGLEGWSWIFIVEGLLTFVCAIPGVWLIQDFPARAKLFKGNERQKWQHHLHTSQGVTSAEVPFSWVQVRKGLSDWRAYVYAVMYFSIAMPFYCLSLFLPTIIAGLGYKGPQANALSTPPYVLGFLTTLAVCWASDRYKNRGLFMVGTMSVCCIGYIILLAQYKPAVSYFACFLAVAGVSPGIALAITWVGANWGPVFLRAAVLGLFFSFGNSAGIASSWSYPSKTTPRFFMGHSLALGFAFLAIVCACILMIDHRSKNAKKDAKYGPITPGLNPLRADTATIEKWGLTGKSHHEVVSLGHDHPGFRYMW